MFLFHVFNETFKGRIFNAALIKPNYVFDLSFVNFQTQDGIKWNAWKKVAAFCLTQNSHNLVRMSYTVPVK